MPITATPNVAKPVAKPAAAPPSLVQPGLLETAKKGPVDVVALIPPPASGSAKSALNLLATAESLPRGPERKQLVHKTLTNLGTQAISAARPTLQGLVDAGKAAGLDELPSASVVRLRGATTDAIEALTKMGATIAEDKIPVEPWLPNAYTDAVEGAVQVGTAQPSDDAIYIDWGVKKMNALHAWKQGITGAGLTIASLDTGVITDHPGLKQNYRGTRPDGTQDHKYNWANFVEGTNKDSYPIDDVGHGTHTIGNSVGTHPNHIIGVAPDSQFVAVRGLGNAGGNLFGMIGAMQWMLAPTDLEGKNPRPDLAPDIVTNSWGGAGQANPFMWAELRNWRRAGLIPVFAAGNTGRPGAVPASVASPGLHEETITVGSTEKDDSRAMYSNRGPSYYAKDVKPEVTAPGSKVYSAWTDGTFRDTFVIDGKPYPASGTSMATPHASGAVALYMQAHPNATFDEIRQALQASGTEKDAKNEDTGYGRIQIEKLITNIDKDAKLTDPKRVAELEAAWSKAKVFGEDPPASDTPPAK